VILAMLRLDVSAPWLGTAVRSMLMSRSCEENDDPWAEYYNLVPEKES